MFQYSVYFWDEDEGKERTVKGIVSVDTYGDAADRLVDYYGADNVISMELMELEDVLETDELKEVVESCDM